MGSMFYMVHPEAEPTFGYVHDYFKEYTSHGSVEICMNNINWGTENELDELSSESIEFIKSCLDEGWAQGMFHELNKKGEEVDGWWAIVR